MAYLGDGGYIAEKNDISLPMLPKMMCFINDELVEEIPRGTEYIKSRPVSVGRPTIQIRAYIAKDVDVDFVSEWFEKTINRGSYWFHAELLFFGIKDIFRCRFIKNFKISSTAGITVANVTIEIDTFYNKFVDPANTYVLSCDGLIGCDALFRCS